MKKIKILLGIVCVIIFGTFYWICSGLSGLNYERKVELSISFLGAIIGGVVTLIALWVSTNETRKIQQENREYILKKDYLDDIKKNKPLLTFKEREKNKEFNYQVRCSIGEYEYDYICIYNIKNVGLGVAKDIEIMLYIKEKNDFICKKYPNFIQAGEEVKDLSIELREEYTFIIMGELDMSKPIILKYRDIFDNQYTVKYYISHGIFQQYLKYINIKSVEIEENIKSYYNN